MEIVRGIRSVARNRAVALISVGLLFGAIAGYLTGSAAERQRASDSHSATDVVLTGTVVMSNMEQRWIIFYPDGLVDPDNDADYRWDLILDYWQDVDGVYHSDGTYPPCLAVNGGTEPNPRRVELTSIDWKNGTRQPMHVAVRVRCLTA
jgi:hypothetical protein